MVATSEDGHRGTIAPTTMARAPTDPRRRIPQVASILDRPEVTGLIELYGRDQVRIQVQGELDALRGRLEGTAPAETEELDAALSRLPGLLAAGLEERLGRPLARTLNATGIFLHTNLGRAPLPPEVARDLAPLVDGYCDLEIDLDDGVRSDRNRRARGLLSALTGADAALVANNCAGALLLVLATLARGREVVVSRGELVEIGGSFRIPEILEAAGARLVEVGTTNRTRPADYAGAIGPDTALLLKVFPSNYRISGFVAAVSPGELAALGREHGLPLLVDEGSGLLRPHRAPQLAGHPSFAELVEAGVDLVAGSGDKLLGGPQAGLLVGTRELVERCRRHPLYRALRPDRAAFASLEAVLRRHLAGRPMPLDRLWPDPGEHRRRLAAAAGRLGAEVVPADAFIGGGSAPETPIPGEALALPGDESLLARLRRGQPPVVGYLREGRLILDLRTVAETDDPALLAAVERELEHA